MTTKILGTQITAGTIETTQLSNTATATLVKTLAPKVLYANVASNTFTVLDDTAVNVGGGYIVVTGAEFQSGATVLIDTTPASAVTYVNSTTLQVQVPTKSAASYNLYVVNPDGGVGIKVAGITYSSEPAWVTSSPLSGQNSGSSFGINLSATGAASYSLAAGSTLPAGTTLAANGYFSGTITVGSETTYTFSVVATDAENQDSSKTFQVTITVSAPKLYGWGKQHYGVPLPSDVVASSPVQIGSDSTWGGNITTGGNKHVLAIKTNGTLWAWGRNWAGQLGTNNAIDYSSPVQIGAGTTWLKLAAGKYFSMAIKTDGTLWTWGYGGFGMLGLNNGSVVSSPTQVGTGTNWSLISSAGKYASAAIKTDGTLWTWGNNQYGELGLSIGSTNYKSSPTQVGTASDWVNLPSSNGSDEGQMAAIKTDGTLWTWGRNTYGQLGQSDTVNKSSPVQVAGTTWTTVACGFSHTLATKTDGTLWAWGGNNSGNLGLNLSTINARSSPVQVGTNTNWPNNIAQRDKLFAGLEMNGVIKTDGTLWTWGAPVSGGLGLNDPSTYKSSPTQVGSSTKWTKITGGNNNSVSVALQGYFMMAINDGA
jgi:alpha-tubulin suppressor-like RCC1 family protein